MLESSAQGRNRNLATNSDAASLQQLVIHPHVEKEDGGKAHPTESRSGP